jgi:hypothetical protein
MSEPPLRVTELVAVRELLTKTRFEFTFITLLLCSVSEPVPPGQDHAASIVNVQWRNQFESPGLVGERPAVGQNQIIHDQQPAV